MTLGEKEEKQVKRGILLNNCIDLTPFSPFSPQIASISKSHNLYLKIYPESNHFSLFLSLSPFSPG